MTVCVSVKVHDCLVFAADSASSLGGIDANGEPYVVNVWNHGNKVFNLYKGMPLAAMTCGLGNMGPASIGNLAKDFRWQITNGDDSIKIDPKHYTVQEVAEKARAFFDERFKSIEPPPPQPQFEFWVGGYGSNCDNAELWKVSILDATGAQLEMVLDESMDGNVAWGGQPMAINRLLLGYDPRLMGILMNSGVEQKTAEELLDVMRDELQTPLVHAAMPVSDAINLADFLVDLTKRYFAFLPGADIVGGATDIATVTKHEGFKWIKRKHYYSSEFNPRETDHVS